MVHPAGALKEVAAGVAVERVRRRAAQQRVVAGTATQFGGNGQVLGNDDIVVSGPTIGLDQGNAGKALGAAKGIDRDAAAAGDLKALPVVHLVGDVALAGPRADVEQQGRSGHVAETRRGRGRLAVATCTRIVRERERAKCGARRIDAPDFDAKCLGIGRQARGDTAGGLKDAEGIVGKRLRHGVEIDAARSGALGPELIGQVEENLARDAATAAHFGDPGIERHDQVERHLEGDLRAFVPVQTEVVEVETIDDGAVVAEASCGKLRETACVKAHGKIERDPERAEELDVQRRQDRHRCQFDIRNTQLHMRQLQREEVDILAQEQAEGAERVFQNGQREMRASHHGRQDGTAGYIGLAVIEVGDGIKQVAGSRCHMRRGIGQHSGGVANVLGDFEPANAVVDRGQRGEGQKVHPVHDLVDDLHGSDDRRQIHVLIAHLQEIEQRDLAVGHVLAVHHGPGLVENGAPARDELEHLDVGCQHGQGHVERAQDRLKLIQDRQDEIIEEAAEVVLDIVEGNGRPAAEAGIVIAGIDHGAGAEGPVDIEVGAHGRVGGTSHVAGQMDVDIRSALNRSVQQVVAEFGNAEAIVAVLEIDVEIGRQGGALVGRVEAQEAHIGSSAQIGPTDRQIDRQFVGRRRVHIEAIGINADTKIEGIVDACRRRAVSMDVERAKAEVGFESLGVGIGLVGTEVQLNIAARHHGIDDRAEVAQTILRQRIIDRLLDQRLGIVGGIVERGQCREQRLLDRLDMMQGSLGAVESR